MNAARTTARLAAFIAASPLPLADARGLRDALYRDGFDPYEVHRHFTTALNLARDLRDLCQRRVAA